VDDATSDAEQRAAAGVLHHWTTDLLSLYSPALTLREHRERYAIAPQSAAYCSSNASTCTRPMCAQTAKQRPIIASPPRTRTQSAGPAAQAAGQYSILPHRAPHNTQRASASRAHALTERGTRLESWQ
jgi:hypothetical protein